MRAPLIGGLVVGASLLALSVSANASSFTVADSYWGGYNTYDNYAPPNTAADIIGNSDFEIYGVTGTRTGNDLSVTVFTNFTGHIGEDNVGLGALFLANGNVSYNTSAPNYAGQVSAGPPTYAYDLPSADLGRFDFAAAIPTNPGGTSGTGTLYGLNGTGNDVVLANVNGNPITAPVGGNPGYYFRAGQDVGVSPQTGTTSLESINWSIGTGSFTDLNGTHSTGTLTFDIANAFGLGLQDSFTLAWAMTCANDVIYVASTLGANTTTPIPASLPLFVGGAGLIGLFARKRRKGQALAVA